MARCARHHNKTQAAHHFGCCWATIHAAVQRVAEYELTGDIRVLQNKARRKSGRTRPEVEEWVIAIYRALGIQLRIAPRAQSKGKEERINQFIERDFLDEVCWQVTSLADLNQRADDWLADYNHTHPA
jgi:hypothetical protein